VSALVVALIASAQIELRAGYGEYFVGDGDDYEDVRESDRLQRLALIVGVSGYWAYIAVFIAASVGLVVHYKFSCKRIAWFFTSVVSPSCLLPPTPPVHCIRERCYVFASARSSSISRPTQRVVDEF